MSHPPRPGNEMKAQVRRYRVSLVRGPHKYIPPVGSESNQLRECNRRLRQLSRANSPIQLSRVRHPTQIESMVKPWAGSEKETLP